jgi:hypothetical protein
MPAMPAAAPFTPPPPGGGPIALTAPPPSLAQPGPVGMPAEYGHLEPLIASLADIPDRAAANAATLIVGDTGTGKTNLLATAAEYCWEVHQKVTRLYAGDPGGFGTKVQSLMRLGILQVYRLRNHIEAFETAELCSQGYWPEAIDPQTGIAAPTVRLIPPTITEYTIACPRGHVVQQILKRRNISPQTVCPAPGCGMVVNQTNWTVSERTLRSPGFSKVGLYCFESLSSWSSWIMGDMADRSGRDELGGEKGAINKIVSGELVIGSNNRAHYGFAQLRAEQWVINSAKIPGAVLPPIWTALELRASDEGGLPVYGPKIAGKAKTDEVPSWFGNCLNSTKEKDERSQDVHRLWLVTHSNVHEGNIPHLAKHRSDPALMPNYLEDPINPTTGRREPFTGFSLNVFFRLLDKALAQSVRRDGAKYPNAPALQEAAAALDPEEAEALELLNRKPQTQPAPTIAQIPGMPSGVIPGVAGMAPPPAPPIAGLPMVGGPIAGGVVQQTPAPAPGLPTTAQTPPAAAPTAGAVPGVPESWQPFVQVPGQVPGAPGGAASAPRASAPPPMVPMAPPPALPPQAPVQQAPKAPAAPVAPPAAQAPSAPPQPSILPPAAPVSVSGPTAAPVRPTTASTPPPPPPGATIAAPRTRKPAPATATPPPAGGPGPTPT